MKVYKYPVGAFETPIEMPVGATVLTFAMQGEQACVWALVDPDAEKETRTFLVVGTGHGIRTTSPDDEFKYVGTAHLYSGLVFHCFEIVTKEPHDAR